MPLYCALAMDDRSPQRHLGRWGRSLIILSSPLLPAAARPETDGFATRGAAKWEHAPCCCCSYRRLVVVCKACRKVVISALVPLCPCVGGWPGRNDTSLLRSRQLHREPGQGF